MGYGSEMNGDWVVAAARISSQERWRLVEVINTTDPSKGKELILCFFLRGDTQSPEISGRE